MDTKPRTRGQLRNWLAQRLRLSEVPSSVWAHEEVEECVEAYLAGTGPLADVFTTARRVIQQSIGVAQELEAIRARRTRLPEVARPQDLFEELLTEYELAHMEAIVVYTAYLAGLRADVRAFRRDVLGGHLLSEEQAEAFLCSPVVRFFTLDQCRAWGIPPVGHTASVVDYHEAPVRRFAVAVEPPAQVFWVECTGEPKAPLLLYEDVLDKLPLPEMWPGSIADHAQQLSEQLSRDYAWYEHEGADATRFLLTGRRPLAPPFRMDHEFKFEEGRFQGEITLTVAPWLSSATIQQIYRRLQRALYGEPPSRRSVRNLRVFQFVIERRASEGYRPPWSQLMVAWNREHPTDMYKDHRLFRRDFHRAAAHLLAIPLGFIANWDRRYRMAKALLEYDQAGEPVADVAKDVAKQADDGGHDEHQRT